MSSAALRSNPLRPEIMLLFTSAMVIFVFTVTVGILNGTDIVDFDQKTILTHVHTGTLGWLTLSVFAAAFWLFGQEDASDTLRKAARWLAVAAVVAIVAYNVAFLTTYGNWRPVLGSVVLAVIAGVFLWVLACLRSARLTTPHVGVLAAAGTSIAGGVLGVLLGIQVATGNEIFSDTGIDAHPATMVIGFLIPVGMALAEWALFWPRPEPVTRSGYWQMGLPFVGGILIMVGLLADLPPLIMLSLPFEVGGVGIFFYRMRDRLRDTPLLGVGAHRLASASSVFIVANIGLLVYMVVRYEGDFDNAPLNEVLALDHVMFIGVMTNAVIALFTAMTADRRANAAIVDHLVFFAINAGIIVFAVGLFADLTWLKRVATPVMGGGILLALAAHAAWFWLPRAGESRAEAAAATGQ
ncbi:MAG: hypothetical protein Kow0010_18500 [Dehalococcoidia bacterium]